MSLLYESYKSSNMNLPARARGIESISIGVKPRGVKINIKGFQQLHSYEWKWTWESQLWYSPPFVSPDWHNVSIISKVRNEAESNLIEQFLEEGKALKIVRITTVLNWEHLYFDWIKGEDVYRCEGVTTTDFKTDVRPTSIAPIILKIILAVIAIIGPVLIAYFQLQIVETILSAVEAVGEALKEVPTELLYGVVIVGGLFATAILIRAFKKK